MEQRSSKVAPRSLTCGGSMSNFTSSAAAWIWPEVIIPRSVRSCEGAVRSSDSMVTATSLGAVAFFVVAAGEVANRVSCARLAGTCLQRLALI